MSPHQGRGARSSKGTLGRSPRGGRRRRGAFAPGLARLEERTLPAFSFAAAFDVPVALSPDHVALADLNGDGNLDVITSELDASTSPVTGGVSVALGNGDGTFLPSRSYRLDGYTNGMGVADFNHDGHLDVVTPDLFGKVFELPGRGDGTLGPPTSYPAGPDAKKMVVADFNRDGNADLAFSNPDGLHSHGGTISVVMGNGDGSFGFYKLISVAQGTQDIAAGDFNRDGYPDLASPGIYDQAVSVLLTQGGGTSTQRQDYPLRNSNSVATADVNGDGKLDLLVGQAGPVGVLLGKGDGTFQPAGSFSTSTSTSSLAVADFDLDGRPDVAVAGGSKANILAGNGDGTFGAAVSLFVGPSGSQMWLAVGDIDHNGTPDLAVSQDSGKKVTILLNRAGGTGAAPATLDDAGPGYGDTGPWYSYVASTAGYGGSNRFAAAGTGTAVATWQQTGLPAGYYDVQVSWTTGADRADDAKYRIYDGSALVRTVLVNQRAAPVGPAFGGWAFQGLGPVRVSGGTLRVVLDNNADGTVIADAVRIVPVPAPTADLGWSGGGVTAPAAADTQTAFTVQRTYTVTGAAPSADFTISYVASTDAVLGNADDVALGGETIAAAADKAVGAHAGTSPALRIPSGGTYRIFAVLDPASALPETDEANNAASSQAVAVAGPTIVDNDSAGYSDSGPWYSYVASTAGYGGSNRFAAAGAGSAVATWQQSGLAPGTYAVQVTWTTNPDRARNATYRIYDGAALVAAVAVNQRIAPVGPTFGGRPFQALGSVSIGSGTLRVVLDNNADGTVIADAIRIVPA